MKHIGVKIKKIVVLLLLFTWNCSGESGAGPAVSSETPVESPQPVLTGADQPDNYLPLFEGKTIVLMVNPTSQKGDQHLVDYLLEQNVKIKTIYAPEHGFRGEADAGEKVTDSKDSKTGLPIVSLYGKKRKPTAEDLDGVDWVVFDIQDVGARFYTFISSMYFLMEACAEHQVNFMILDRPNPNGHYVDGPVLDPAFQSFVGMHPVPVVHGMTIGEYAQMVNGQGWLPDGAQCPLTVITCKNYTHQTPYELPVKPSPNLPTIQSIYLYPSLCFFEPTNVSIGRGTNKQFQVIGSPGYPKGEFTFTPEPMPGAKQPKLEGELCRGYDLSSSAPADLFAKKQLQLQYLLEVYEAFPDKTNFFISTSFFDKLAGGSQLREQLEAGKTEAEIRQSWEPALSEYKKMRQQYLLYPE